MGWQGLFALWRKDVLSFWLSPLWWVVAAVFLALTGWYYLAVVASFQAPDLRFLLDHMVVLLLFVVPALTMRLWAEEQQRGTAELLLTAPVTLNQVVLAKFFAVLTLLTVLLGVTGIYPAVTAAYGAVEWPMLVVGYLGVWLVAATFAAAGLLASTLSDSQVIAAVAGFGILLALYMLDWAAGAVGGTLGDVLRAASVWENLSDFIDGVLDTRRLVYFLSLIFGFLFLAVRNVERRTWAA
ncbi:ABC transporter permease [Thermaerobacter composti]|uniref:ABC transporter permease n=1 Tax=Thermaerobacter composti TaxID=554949 RepID=A0ABZ0QPT4_9FIRM|nr:ABC transporter permease [Thermaerobacter composti]WPD19500.1 ABC transporter permease [Thermaerobacter composti]